MLRRAVSCLLGLLACTVSLFATAATPWPSNLRPLPDWAWDQIREDVAPFAEGIGSAQLDAYCRVEAGRLVLENPIFKKQGRGVVRFQIRNNQIQAYRTTAWNDGAWTDCYVKALKRLAQRVTLPDMDFVVILESLIGPAVQGPVIGHSKVRGTRGILWPDFEMVVGYSIFSGARPPSGQNPAATSIDHFFSAEPDWDAKIPQLIWRGSTTGLFLTPEGWWKMPTMTLENWAQLPRSRLVLFSLDHPELVNARFTGVVQAARGVREELESRGMLARNISLPEQLKYKYQIDVDGNSCTNSHFYWTLRANSATLKAESEFIQWYHRALVPGRHYMAINGDYSNLAETLDWLRQEDEAAQEIAEAGTDFALNYLNPEMALSYLYAVLIEYSKLYNAAS
jgi:hypothetical protein